MSTFKAIVVEKGEGGQTVALKDFDEKDLMEGDVTVRPEWSTINYKDALAITGKAPVVRRFPMIAGLDFAGIVESSSHPDWKAGDKVIGNGWGMSETHLGAYAQKARVKGDWLVRVPATMSARDAMAIGTAGYTAMLVGDRARARRRHARQGAGDRDRRRRRRRLGRGRAARQARLPGDRVDRPAAARPIISKASAHPKSSTARNSKARPSRSPRSAGPAASTRSVPRRSPMSCP